jgi:hypothetical protein
MVKIGVKRWRTKAMDRGKYVRRPRFFKNCRATEKNKKKTSNHQVVYNAVLLK